MSTGSIFSKDLIAFSMTAFDMETCDRFHAPYLAVIGNNSAMNQIRYGQIAKYGEQRGNVGNKLGDVEFSKFAHMLGNHGPAYYRRYPPAFRRYTPTCDSSDIGRCTQESIITSYDNAILYTDDLLARAIAFLLSDDSSYMSGTMMPIDGGWLVPRMVE